MSGRVLFGDPGERARLAPAWATFFIALLMLLFAVVVLVIAIFGFAVTAVAQDPSALDDVAAFMQAHAGNLIVIQFLTLYPALALAAVFWTKVVERRSLASIGLIGAGWPVRYVRGVLGGIVMAAALFAGAALVASLLGVDADEFANADWSLLSRQDYVNAIAMAVVFVLIQSACEEIAFRGWMLSAATLRAGLLFGVILSSVTFGLIHIDRMLIGGFVLGVLVVAGTGMVGAAFAYWARIERSIIGVMGAHGGFNVTLIIGALIALIATSDGATVSEIIAQMQEDLATELASEGAAAQVIVQVVLFGALAVILARIGGARERGLSQSS